MLIHRFSKTKGQASARAAELGIAGIVGLTNACVANNTVSIVVSGDIAKNLAEKYKISAKRSASIMDIFACIVQGLIPYGAQALLVASIFAISPIAAITYTWYGVILGVVAIAIVLLRKREQQVSTQTE